MCCSGLVSAQKVKKLFKLFWEIKVTKNMWWFIAAGYVSIEGNLMNFSKSGYFDDIIGD